MSFKREQNWPFSTLKQICRDELPVSGSSHVLSATFKSKLPGRKDRHIRIPYISLLYFDRWIPFPRAQCR